MSSLYSLGDSVDGTPPEEIYPHPTDKAIPAPTPSTPSSGTRDIEIAVTVPKVTHHPIVCAVLYLSNSDCVQTNALEVIAVTSVLVALSLSS